MEQTVLIADDHSLVKEAVASRVNALPDYTVVAQASDGREALDLLETYEPQIAILDGSMPSFGGIEIIDIAHEQRLPTKRFVLLTMFDHPQLLADAIEAGANACLSKSDASGELEQALRAIGEDEFYVSRSMQRHYDALNSGEVIGLTRREREIMESIVAGLSTKEIAAHLGIAPKTADAHRTSLMRKINAHNAADVVRYAMKMGVGVL